MKGNGRNIQHLSTVVEDRLQLEGRGIASQTRIIACRIIRGAASIYFYICYALRAAVSLAIVHYNRMSLKDDAARHCRA